MSKAHLGETGRRPFQFWETNEPAASWPLNHTDLIDISPATADDTTVCKHIQTQDVASKGLSYNYIMLITRSQSPA
jgi:hypothetical protein